MNHKKARYPEAGQRAEFVASLFREALDFGLTATRPAPASQHSASRYPLMQPL